MDIHLDLCRIVLGTVTHCVLRRLVKYREPVVKCLFIMEDRGLLKTSPSAIHSVGDSVTSTCLTARSGLGRLSTLRLIDHREVRNPIGSYQTRDYKSHTPLAPRPGAFSRYLWFGTDPVCPCTSRRPRKRCLHRRGSIRNILIILTLRTQWGHPYASWRAPTTAYRPPHLFPDFSPLPPNCHRINICSTTPNTCDN